jgi:hypothetical protein
LERLSDASRDYKARLVCRDRKSQAIGNRLRP